MASLLQKGLIFILCLNQGLGSNSVPTLSGGCVCPGDTLAYNCTVSGAGFTIWNGTAFDCAGSKIILRHNSFATAAGECNDGAIVARSLGVDGNNYTSQLIVNVTPDMNNKTVMCFYDDGTSMDNLKEIALMTSINLISEDLIPAPNNLHISVANFISRKVTFKWSAVALDCQAVHYNITSSNCGSCPTTTTNTTVTCTDVISNDTNTRCTFAVQAVVCGIQGNANASIAATIATLPKGSSSSPSTLIAGVMLIIIAIALIVGFIVFQLARKSIIKSHRCNGAKVHHDTMPQALHTEDLSIRNPASEDKISPPRSFHSNGTGRCTYSSDKMWQSWQQNANTPSNTGLPDDDAQVYSALNKCEDKADGCIDNPPAKPPRRRSSVNKPGSTSVTVDYHIYDRTSHF